ncbi:D-glycero-beta-D-manno-heptose-7-phosphate kinase [Aerophototrophica crusticola]|uniref:Bifunctional protein HldE n=1 Tax=Aerophototrophica crusticola TaxID=1709002 RepID=A0A858RA50_9PROT|nr:D-glycero-beta-D-manno-heptose-7-phosphate kinase [Rhodospirillaceae bacterium B3]
MSDLSSLVDALPKARVLVVGDVMLDRFTYGKVERISPEAPIPVLRVEREAAMLGGAGNVANNLAALGARATLLSVVGEDAAGAELSRLLTATLGQADGLVVEAGRQTTTKVRFIAGSQQLLRADQETVASIADGSAGKLIQKADALLRDAAVLVLSDYGKGVLTDELTSMLIALARRHGKPVLVDPKGSDYGRYRGATAVTPNRKELAQATGLSVTGDSAVAAACRLVMDRAGIGAVVATRSEEGMSVVTADGATHLRAEAREVFDVSGAGDTVMATLAAALAVGADLPAAARLANAAAGIVVGKVGTAVVRPEELRGALRRSGWAADDAKVASLEGAVERVERWRRLGCRVGFTNGCFDLLHPGHVSLLTQARAACDKLVVGLNSDASVKRLKGESRPVQSELARATVLASLASVDLVVVFGEDTPLELIQALRPDVLVKGADYTVDTVVGAPFVQSYGGQVVLAELVDGQSTTRTIARMKG